jgi:hypothetical protein
MFLNLFLYFDTNQGEWEIGGHVSHISEMRNTYKKFSLNTLR